MDIKALYTSETADVVINNPATGKPTDVVITIHGMYHGKFRKVYAEFLKRAGEDDTLADLDADALADLTVDWAGLTKSGKTLKHTRGAAVDLYTNAAVVRSQLISALLTGADFLPDA